MEMLTDKEIDLINSCFTEYEKESSAYERVKEIENYFNTVDYDNDAKLQYCIAVLDSEFMNYPEDTLEKALISLMNKYANSN